MPDSTNVTKNEYPPPAKNDENKRAATDATTLGTGQYFVAVLLAVTPTAFGGALSTMDPNNQNPSPAQWSAELAKQRDTQDVNNALLSILTSPLYLKIVTALRTPQPLLDYTVDPVNPTPVTYNDGTAVKIDYVQTVRSLVFDTANANNLLTTPWSGGPPHPKGQDLLNLITLLNGFNETS